MVAQVQRRRLTTADVKSPWIYQSIWPNPRLVVTIPVFEAAFGGMAGTVPGPHACRAHLKRHAVTCAFPTGGKCDGFFAVFWPRNKARGYWDPCPCRRRRGGGLGGAGAAASSSSAPAPLQAAPLEAPAEAPKPSGRRPRARRASSMPAAAGASGTAAAAATAAAATAAAATAAAACRPSSLQ